MKRQNIILVSLFLICLISCDKNGGISFGTAEYYPSFLWVDENSTPVTKTFDFEFSEDAQNDHSCFAEFQFVDKDGKPISTDVMQVSIDGGKIKNNRFRINSDVKSKEISFMFSPNAEEGKHQGYLKLVGHNLERLNEQPLSPSQHVNAFKWTLNYDKVMNPLAIVLICIGLGILVLLLLWFIFIKPLLFPKIRVNRIEISSNNYFLNKRINGFRMVVITNKYKQQSWTQKVFTGKILYIKDSIWTSSWELSPKGRKKALKISLHGKYIITPVTSELANFSEYQLNNIETKDSYKIKIL